MFSSRFVLFPTITKIFLEKQFFLISRFVLFSTLKKYIEKCPFTYWLKWEVVSPNSREGQLESTVSSRVNSQGV